MNGFHYFLENISPELTLIGLIIGVVGAVPGIVQLFAKPKEPVITVNYNVFVNAQIGSLQQKKPLWDRFWNAIAEHAGETLSEAFFDGIEGVIGAFLFAAFLGYESITDYSDEVSLGIALIVLICILSATVTLVFLKRVRSLPIGVYLCYLLTCLFSVISAYFICFVGSGSIVGLKGLLYCFLRAVGVAMATIPVLLSTGAIIASLRDKHTEYHNSWFYLFLSLASVFLCSDVAFKIFD